MLLRLQRMLPADRTLLAGIHVLGRARAEQERLHDLREEAACLRIHHVEAVVIDQHRLLTQPVSPAILTDLRHDARADRPGNRRACEARARLLTTPARYIRSGRTPPSRVGTAAGDGCTASRCRTRTTSP